MFIFARCLRSSAAVTPVKYEFDIIQLMSVLIILKNWENNGTEKITWVTPTSQTRSYRAYEAIETPLFSNHLMLPRCITNVKFAQDFIGYWKWFYKWLFSTLNIDLKDESNSSKIAQKCIWCCGRVQRCVTAPHWARRWGNIVQWGMKVCGQDRNAAMFSLFLLMPDRDVARASVSIILRYSLKCG